MDPYTIRTIIEGVKDVGTPTIVCLGLLGILYQQNNILKDIRESINSLLLELRGSGKVVINNEARQPNPQVSAPVSSLAR